MKKQISTSLVAPPILPALRAPKKFVARVFTLPELLARKKAIAPHISNLPSAAFLPSTKGNSFDSQLHSKQAREPSKPKLRSKMKGSPEIHNSSIFNEQSILKLSTASLKTKEDNEGGEEGEIEKETDYHQQNIEEILKSENETIEREEEELSNGLPIDTVIPQNEKIHSETNQEVNPIHTE